MLHFPFHSLETAPSFRKPPIGTFSLLSWISSSVALTTLSIRISCGLPTGENLSEDYGLASSTPVSLASFTLHSQLLSC